MTEPFPQPAPEPDCECSGTPELSMSPVESPEAAQTAGDEAAPDAVAPSAAARPRLFTRTASALLRTCSWAASIVVIAVFVITFILQAFQIPSDSMEDTLMVGDFLLVDKVHFAQTGSWGRLEAAKPLERGDIVVFRYPVNPQQHFVKRIIGLPGDRIRLIDKAVYVNGRRLIEPYVTYRSATLDRYRDDFPDPEYSNANVDGKWWLEMRRRTQNGELVVPQGRYFVLGDNRDDSLDSRYWGFVPRENIVGRPLLIYFSMRRPEGLDATGPELPNKLRVAGYNLMHVLEFVRWNRCLRLIR